MIKHNEELHVSLRDHMRVKLEGRSVTIVAFDGVLINEAPDPMTGFVEFAADTLYRMESRTRGVRSITTGESATTETEAIEAVKFRGKIYVSASNIAGIVPQPFRKS